MPNEERPNDEPKPETERLSTDEPIENQVVEGDYTADSIQVLEGLEAVRKRPGMYVGDNGKKGLHHMFKEVLDNSVDEALAGHCDQIDVIIYDDNSVSVRDNGRGIPVDMHEKFNVSALQVVMTMLHAGGKFGGGSYKTSGGLHGVGVSCTNALSEWCEVTVSRDGKQWFQRYERGIPVEDVKAIGKATGTGTFTRWQADSTVLTDVKYDVHIFKTRLRELAYLNPTVKFTFKYEPDQEQSEEFHFKRGIPQLVEDLNDGKDTLHPVIYFRRQKDSTQLEVALQYHSGYNETVLAFSNMIHQPDGGTHVSGFSAALTRVVNAYARKNNYLKEKDTNFSSDDVSDGLTAVISLRLENPSYNSQDKVKLVTPEVQGMTNSLVGDGLSTFFDENPAVARRIVDKAIIAQRAREAARKAAEAVKRSSVMDSFGLPGKLSDCQSKDMTKCEIFLVEGDSAGGSAKAARDRVTQAILPLRGKILNVERARVDKALDNEEIKALIAALGVGIDLSFGRKEHDEEDEGNGNGKSNGNGKDTSFDLSKLRYNKIIIMTDADVDGEHIRTLLLTFFYRYMKPLIAAGHIYLAQPPLFVVRVGNNERYYAQSEEERDELIKQHRRGKKEPQVTRFKGLGEMNGDQLGETTMDPANRVLVQVKLDPEFEMDIEQMFSRLMGDKVEPRREFIEKHAKQALNVDWHY
ncbi:MAG TPA: DNA topoisomerase subunit B [Fimbriimonadaceae bacterium]|nr:DNA topoisomerase subunit B [Fimbriimonadaceae bacterium]